MNQKMNSLCSKIQFLSGAWLKLIAIVSMLIDHVNKALIYPNLVSNNGALTVVSNLFDIIGRIAFPLFCFMVVEGYFKTRSRKKYLLHLLIFGVISEVPFDMFTTASFFNMNWNNVMFTLALVLITIWIIDILKEKMQNLPKALWYFVSLIIVLIICIAAMYLSLDYEHHAILIGYFFYLFHDIPLAAIPFCYASMYTQPWALLGFGLTLTYNGERGKQNKMFNYWFYPVHLLILGILRLCLGL
ncbi:MAG: conjugal transfer protein TraX [Clostridiales bacterium]|nr:conjugal transfer protein TraX [Clostridiales bacterium]MDY3745816.1 TraX family protein [Lachnospiraceae bacterium]